MFPEEPREPVSREPESSEPDRLWAAAWPAPSPATPVTAAAPPRAASSERRLTRAAGWGLVSVGGMATSFIRGRVSGRR